MSEERSPAVLEDLETPSKQTPEGRRPKSSHRGWIWLLVLVVVAAAAYFLVLKPRKIDPQMARTATQGAAGGRARGGATPVVAVKATRGDIGVYINGLGAVTPVYTVTVISQISGYLMKVLYQEGDMVHQGEPLAEIDPRPYQVMLEQAQGALARDEAALANAKVDLGRYQTLLPHNAVPEQTLATQEALVRQDEATVKVDQGQIDSAKLDLVYCHITAPITGRVGLRLVDPGNYVQTSNGLVVITQLQPITVVFPIAEDPLPDVLKEWRAGRRLRVDAYDRTLTTKLASGWLATIDNQIDPTTGTVKMRATFDNQDNALFPNQFVNARLLVREKQGVTLVPSAVIQRNGPATYVWVVKPDSTVTVRNITVGTSEGDQSEVTSGLEPGETIVITGVDRLQEGSKVTVQLEGGNRRGK